jgi:TIR domain
MEWDVFISHAWEDKEAIARPLADGLLDRGITVWFDAFTLTVGDSLRRSIDHGLAQSRFGIVVISKNFLRKEWPQKELDGLVAREVDGIKVILPVWHEIGAAEIRSYSPLLADRLAASSDKGLDHVIAELMRAIRRDHPAPRPEDKPDFPASETSRTARLREFPSRWLTGVSVLWKLVALMMLLAVSAAAFLFWESSVSLAPQLSPAPAPQTPLSPAPQTPRGRCDGKSTSICAVTPRGRFFCNGIGGCTEFIAGPFNQSCAGKPAGSICMLTPGGDRFACDNSGGCTVYMKP